MYSGTDLTGLVVQKRWATLSDLIHELPKASRTWEAVMNDPELASEILAAQNRDATLDPDSDVDDMDAAHDGTPGWQPQYRDYDLHAKQLADVINALAGLNQSVIAAAGGKARKVDPYPVPATALPEAELEQARQDGDAILSMLGMGDAIEH